MARTGIVEDQRTKTCPQCKKKGSIQKLFGYRHDRYAQSWCTSCRKTGNLGPAPGSILISDSLADTRHFVYHRIYPEDKAWQTRSWKFMVEKIMKKLGGKARLTKAAWEKLNRV